MKYCLIFKDKDIDILLAKFNTSREAESMKHILAFVTNEYPFEQLEIIEEEKNDDRN